MFGHIATAVSGLTLVIAYLIGGDPTWLAWTAAVVLLAASLLGAAMFIPWWLRRRAGVRSRTADSASRLPVERHFPLRVVIVHGLVADFTLALVLLVALGVGR